jgi:hypothetical protein
MQFVIMLKEFFPVVRCKDNHGISVHSLLSQHSDKLAEDMVGVGNGPIVERNNVRSMTGIPGIDSLPEKLPLPAEWDAALAVY